MKIYRRSLLYAVVVSGLVAGGYRAFSGEAVETVRVQRIPDIDPDYAGVVVPPNIAPLNFSVQEEGVGYRVRIHAGRGKEIRISSDRPQIVIPAAPWRKMLRGNRGRALYVEIRVERDDGSWVEFQPIENLIAEEEIDGYLVYRLLKPLYNKYVNIGIYQRNLETYEESAVLENRSADHACFNCHTFLQNRPDPMILQTRSRHGLTMLLAREGKVSTIDTRTAFNRSPAAYTSWHPSGTRVIFSVNKVSLFFHTTGETRDVFDAGSDLLLYQIDSNLLTTTRGIAHPDSLETWPTWSPDGRYLYFCRAPKLPIERFREVRYDLMRIPYDPESGAWGKPETVLAAAETGRTINQPKISPDGRYLLFCMADYGNFPVFLASSDLYLMDLETGQYHRLEINSDQSDSWHSWSSNGRWFVFSSKRRDGLFARPYLCYFDREGTAHKPVLLPQEDPTFYDSFVKTYNVPELVKGPVKARARDLARAVYDPPNFTKARLDPQVEGIERSEDSRPVREAYSPGKRK